MWWSTTFIFSVSLLSTFCFNLIFWFSSYLSRIQSDGSELMYISYTHTHIYIHMQCKRVFFSMFDSWVPCQVNRQAHAHGLGMQAKMSDTRRLPLELPKQDHQIPFTFTSVRCGGYLSFDVDSSHAPSTNNHHSGCSCYTSIEMYT